MGCGRATNTRVAKLVRQGAVNSKMRGFESYLWCERKEAVCYSLNCGVSGEVPGMAHIHQTAVRVCPPQQKVCYTKAHG